jgi:hypothetical protein
MKLQSQVCSRPLAQRLAELGVKQESAFYWCEYTHSVEQESGYGEIQTDWLLCPASEMKRCGLDAGLCFPAFTVAELGEMLPHHVASYWIDAEPRYWMSFDERKELNSNTEQSAHDAATEADARAKMLVYLIENNLLTA